MGTSCNVKMRLLTLTGPGGIGKTRLGLQVAAELSEVFRDGVFFVDLAPISDPELVVPTIAQTLEVKEGAGQPLFDLVTTFLRDKQVLLLLDNFEQALFRELADTQGTALSLLWLGEITFWTGSLVRSRKLLEEALTLFRELDDPWGIAFSLERLASVALEQGSALEEVRFP